MILLGDAMKFEDDLTHALWKIDVQSIHSILFHSCRGRRVPSDLHKGGTFEYYVRQVLSRASHVNHPNSPRIGHLFPYHLSYTCNINQAYRGAYMRAYRRPYRRPAYGDDVGAELQ